MSQAGSSGETPANALLRLINGYRASQAIHVAARLGIADLLARGTQSSDDLAAVTGADPPSLYRLLRALASIGVLREEPNRHFALTPLGACLRSDADESVRPRAIFTGEEYMWEAWGHLLHSVHTGETAIQHLYGMDVWQYRAEHPDASRVFDEAQTGNVQGAAASIAEAYDFSRFARVVDVAGGQGALLAAILSRYPTVQGVLFDQSHVVAASREVLEAAGVAQRCRVIAGNMFESVPGGGDAYVLKSILHDWPDEEAVAILRRCREALDTDGRLLVVQMVVGPPNEDPAAKFTDLQMLVAPGGRERTREESETLLSAADFQLVDIHATAGSLSIVEAIPI